MKKYFNFVIAGLFMFSLFGFASANTVESTVLVATIEPAEISFIAPDTIDFGEITQGYNSPEVNFSVINDGETDIRVEVSLVAEESDLSIFNNLKFKKEGTVTTRTLSSFYLTIDKPEEGEEPVIQNASMWLDLTKYTEAFTEPIETEAELVFTAMPD